jgi:hypothetical protein
LFEVAACLLLEKSPGCIPGSALESEEGHRNSALHSLEDPTPEAFFINFNYSVRNATAMDALALFLSIPEGFYAKKNLY